MPINLINVLSFVPFALSKQVNYTLLTFLTIALTLAKENKNSYYLQKTSFLPIESLNWAREDQHITGLARFNLGSIVNNESLGLFYRNAHIL